MKKLINLVQQYDLAGKNNIYFASVKKTITQAVRNSQSLNFVCFTCSTINSEFLFDKKNPWRYVSDNPQGNNLEPDIKKLEDIIIDIRKIYPKINLKILIGNTDPYYIYFRQFKNFDPLRQTEIWTQFQTRWTTYRQNFEIFINSRTPSLSPEIISWYEFEKNIENSKNVSFEKEYEKTIGQINHLFTPGQFAWELKSLAKQFGSNKYFAKANKPTEKILQDWIIRKFGQYAVQGKWIYENIPNAILIQNEKPSDLRSTMYQPLIKNSSQENLPIVYFLGVDNLGYQ